MGKSAAPMSDALVAVFGKGALSTSLIYSRTRLVAQAPEEQVALQRVAETAAAAVI
jgi:hypothetical protein